MIGTGRWFFGDGYHVQFKSGLIGSVQSRPLLEARIRKRLKAFENVRFCEGVSVQGIEADAQNERITAILIQDKQTFKEERIHTDLLIDATGRGSKTAAWLESLGYKKPVEERIKINLAYASRIYKRQAADLGKDTGLVIAGDPPNKRGGVVIPIEGDRWMVTLAGFLGDHPPTDPEGFLEFAKHLQRPDVYELMLKAEPLSDIALYTFPANVRRYYDKLERYPEGYLVIGDAMCSFNPIYGQGMTVAALESEALNSCLKEGQENLAKRFFKAAAKLIDVPWQIAVGGDLRYPEVEGKRTAQDKFVNWYISRMHKAAYHDPKVCLAFHHVTNLIKPPESLFDFEIVLRVIWGNLQREKRIPKRSAKPLVFGEI